MKKPKLKTWDVVFTFSHRETVQAATAKQAERHVRKNLFVGEFPFDKENLLSVHWVDEMGVLHLEGCAGGHCRHYECETDDIHYRCYCSQCDVEAY